jgi:predicted nucleic acid-binding protein
MGCRIINILRKEPPACGRYFLDTNVLLSVYGPYSFDSKWWPYSRFVSDLIKTQCEMFVDLTVIGEYVSVYTRQSLVIYKENKPDPREVGVKAYSRTEHYKAMLQDMGDDMHHVQQAFQLFHSETAWVDIAEMVRNMCAGGASFNDRLIGKKCRENDLILVTDDSDFDLFDISIATANGKLTRGRA